VFAFGEKVPLPVLDHTPPVAFETLPFSWIPELLPHTIWSGPAFTTGAPICLVIITVSDETGQEPFVTVHFNNTVPTPIPVNAEAGLEGLESEATPEMIVHSPVPGEGEFADKLVDVFELGIV
jgi:hypothetical protein